MPERNWACADYMACLDKAAEAGYPGFTCEFCPRRREVRPDWCEMQAADVDGVFAVWTAAFSAPRA